MPVELPGNIVAPPGQDVVAHSVTVKSSGPYTSTLPSGAATPAGVITGKVYDYGGEVFNGLAAGMVADNGVTDNSAAFQIAANAAIALGMKLVIPAPATAGTYYGFASTITLQPAVGSQFFLDIVVETAGTLSGTFQGSIVWTGGNNTSMFRTLGWKNSEVRGLDVQVPATVTGLIVWDLDTSASFPSSSRLSFYDSNVSLTSGATSCVGWRIGHGHAGDDLSFFNWFNCTVNGNDNTKANVGWINEGNNSLNHNWYGGSGLLLGKAISTTSTAGAASAFGNGALFFYGFGGSQNLVDFDLHFGGGTVTASVFGGRFETGTTFVQTTSVSGAYTMIFSGVTLSGYTVGPVFNFLAPGSLTIENLMAYGSAYDATFITLGGFTGQGSLQLIGCSIRGTDPPYTVSAGVWQVTVLGSGILNSSTQATAYFANRLGTIGQALLVTTPAAGTVATLTGGAGGLTDTGNISLQGGRTVIGYDGTAQRTSIAGTKTVVIQPSAQASGITGLELKLPAAGTITAETVGLQHSSQTLTITAGYANQRFAYFQTPTISAATSQTVTDAATVAIQGGPVAAGAGPAVITRGYQLWLQGTGKMRFDTTIQTTIGANGAASALTANPVGYLPVYIGTAIQIIPYYNP